MIENHFWKQQFCISERFKEFIDESIKMSGENEGTSEKDKNNEQLNLKVIGQDGEIVQFKIKRSTPFRKLINAYCDRSRLSASTVRFMFDGNRINDTDTPKSMDMEEDDTIEVFTQQSGGVN